MLILDKSPFMHLYSLHCPWPFEYVVFYYKVALALSGRAVRSKPEKIASKTISAISRSDLIKSLCAIKDSIFDSTKKYGR